MRKFKFLLASVLACSLAISCQKPAPVPVIRVVHANHDHHAALFVAAKLSSKFNAKGLTLKEIDPKKEYELYKGDKLEAKVVLSSSSGGSALVRKLVEDQADVALGGFPAEVIAMDEGAPIKVIAPLMKGGTGVVLRKDIPVANWAEFVEYAKKAKTPLRISFRTEGTTQLFAMQSALKESGISFTQDLTATTEKVIFVNLAGQENLIPSLESKIIDGFIGVQPTLATAESKGAGNIIAFLDDFRDGTGGGLYPCCAVSARTAAIAANPEAIQDLVTLLFKANAFITENPKAAAPVVSEWLGTSVEVEERSLPTIRFINCLDKDWDKSTDVWVARMITSGKLKGEVAKSFEGKKHLEAIYDAKLLEKASQNCCP